MSPSRAIPKSRAYWELKAEQVMNRVFAPESSIDVEIVEGPPPLAAAPPQQPTPRPAPQAKAASRPTGLWRGLLEHPPQALMAGFGLLALALAGSSVAGLSIWNQHQQALRQERNLLLIERLRNLGSGDSTSGAQPADQANAEGSSGAGPELPPPPPDEPWMQELATLPQSSAPPARVLQVPMNDRVGAPAPAASVPARSGGAAPAGGGGGGNLPQLVGVIQTSGSSGSAIFQVGGSSASAAVGESIGSSGWRLRSANGDSAVIERGGEQRQVSISSGF